MRISDWSSDVCSSDLPSSARSCTEARRRTRTMRTIFKGMLAVACMLAASFMGAGEARADKLSEILERGTVRVIVFADVPPFSRSEEHTSELQSLMRSSYAVLCLKKKKAVHNTAR